MAVQVDNRWWESVAPSVLKRSLQLTRGCSVIISSPAYALRSAEAVGEGLRRLGIRSLIWYASTHPNPKRRRVERGFEPQGLIRAELLALSASDGFVSFPPSFEDLKRQAALPPSHRVSLYRRTEELNQILVRHSIPSVWLLVSSMVSPGETGGASDAWASEGFKASAVNPRLFRSPSKQLVPRLRRGRRLTITHPNGTHLELGLAGSPPVLDDGVVDRKDLAAGRVWTMLPSGLLRVAVDAKVAEGRFVASRPTTSLGGSISGLRLIFRNGRLDKYSADAGLKIFEDRYLRAGRERDRPGLFSIGLNPEIHELPLAEDQGLGVVSICLGHNDDYGGRVTGTFRQIADLDAADIFVDDEPLLKSGVRL